MPPTVFWPYCLGAIVLVIGLYCILRYDLPQSRGLDRVLLPTRIFYAIPIAVFAGEHFTVPREIGSMIPHWIPGHLFWAYFVGIALFATGLSFATRQLSGLSGTLLGTMFCLFVVLLDLPAAVTHPHNRITWILALRELSFAGGAFAFAGFEKRSASPGSGSGLIQAARYIISIPAIFYGVEHFLYPACVPGVPLARITPAWIPGRLMAAYLCGASLIICGVLILLNKHARLAAAVLGAVISLIVLWIYLPILIAALGDIGNGVNYFADTLFYAGTILLLALALPGETPANA
ncbi:MAG TPA: hypothetical protein VJN93_12790 [Candidatus Acidoferrum sp.]|nr:hypothetical protein [Candidatus Acidoferrum sp.]